MTPEVRYSFFFAHDHVRVRTLTRHLRESCQRTIRNRFHKSRMAHQRDSFKLSLQVATAVESATIERTNNSVIVDQTQHRYGVNWTLRQELENFCFITVRQSLDFNCCDGEFNRFHGEVVGVALRGHLSVVSIRRGAATEGRPYNFASSYVSAGLRHFSNPDSPCNRRARSPLNW